VNLHGHGVRLAMEPGWEARVRSQAPSQAGRSGNTLLHASTVPMPAERGDFGSGVVDKLGPDDVFVSLFEYDRSEASSALFAAQGLPVVRPSDLSPAAMQRTLPGQTGGQWFFTVAGRPFCLFVVVGSAARRIAGVKRVNALLAGLTVTGAP
jgi:hypothetical protein